MQEEPHPGNGSYATGRGGSYAATHPSPKRKEGKHMKDGKPRTDRTSTNLRAWTRRLWTVSLQDLNNEALRGAAYQAGSGVVTVLILWMESRH